MGGLDPRAYNISNDVIYLRYAVARLAAYSNVWWSLVSSPFPATLFRDFADEAIFTWNRMSCRPTSGISFAVSPLAYQMTPSGAATAKLTPLLFGMHCLQL